MEEISVWRVLVFSIALAVHLLIQYGCFYVAVRDYLRRERAKPVSAFIDHHALPRSFALFVILAIVGGASAQGLLYVLAVLLRPQ